MAETTRTYLLRIKSQYAPGQPHRILWEKQVTAATIADSIRECPEARAIMDRLLRDWSGPGDPPYFWENYSPFEEERPA